MSKQTDLINIPDAITVSGSNVGIGTSSPTNFSNGTVVEAAGGSNTGAFLASSNSGTVVAEIQGNNADGLTYFGSRTNHPVVFRQNGTERMRIDSSGNLLVGTTTAGVASSSSVQGIQIAPTTLSVARSGGQVAFFNRQTNDGAIVDFRKDGSTVGSIFSGHGGTQVGIGSNTTGITFNPSTRSMMPANPSSTSPQLDATLDIGFPSVRWKDLYLSGGVYLGGTGADNKLEDYEEGSWTPVLNFGGGTTGIAYSQQFGNYTKVGRLVHVKLRIKLSNKGSSSGEAVITGIPFNPKDDFTSVAFEKGGGLDNWSDFSTASNYRYTFLQNGEIKIYRIDTNSTSSFSASAMAVNNTNFTNLADIRVTITYTTA